MKEEPAAQTSDGMMRDEKGRDLIQRTTQFALETIRLYSVLPNTTVAQVLGRQMLKSGTSVGAHYREANRAKSNADFISKIEGALQELDETVYWLDLLHASKTIKRAGVEHLIRETDELIAIFVAVAKAAKRKS
ncbi:MAG: four helix bundle protein [Betaproteobacteria bacterium]|nr:four helix bundle protein [Betaproteobacteria bacterium]